MTMKRWQDWANLLLGLWMLFSPVVLGFAGDQPVATSNAVVLGAAIVLFAGIAVYIPKVWEEAINVILGICLMVSPWALGFATHMTATTNAVIAGLLVAAFALWAMVMDTNVRRWMHEHHLMR